jgi:hypothetical protein
MAAASSELRGWTNDQESSAGVLLCLADCISSFLSEFLVRAIAEHLLLIWREAHRIHDLALR